MQYKSDNAKRSVSRYVSGAEREGLVHHFLVSIVGAIFSAIQCVGI